MLPPLCVAYICVTYPVSVDLCFAGNGRRPQGRHECRQGATGFPQEAVGCRASNGGGTVGAAIQHQGRLPPARRDRLAIAIASSSVEIAARAEPASSLDSSCRTRRAKSVALGFPCWAALCSSRIQYSMTRAGGLTIRPLSYRDKTSCLTPSTAPKSSCVLVPRAFMISARTVSGTAA